ncbi:MAG TPA: hypothetical protein VGQ83_27735 [Polyangia bacterium]|jgi:4-amino-4-deoxy-L-arabinose transferase-like glycosyltransferase
MGRFLAALAVVVALAALLGGGLAYRLAFVGEKQYAAGDGKQYHKLAQELVRARRFALGEDKPLTDARLPGYPLFLAYLAVREAPVALADHLVRATRWNALLDVLSAALVFFILWERRQGAGAGLLAVFGVLTCPALMILSAYGLSESLATFLGLAALALAVVAMRRRLVTLAVLAGAVVGLAQLVRLDGVTVLPAVLVALALAAAPWRRRLVAGVLCVAAAGLVFAPWPARNFVRLGRPSVSAGWIAQDGKELPAAVMRWMRSYGTGVPGESYLILRFALQRRVDPRAVVLPAMYDSEAERLRVHLAFVHYNDERFSPAVVAEFAALARERAARAPLRTALGLPLARVYWLWAPLPASDFPMQSKLLDLPAERGRLGDWDLRTFILAAVGLAALLAFGRREGRATAAILVTAIAARTALHAYAHPFPLQRYVVEVFPLVIALAAIGVTALAGPAVRQLARLVRRPAAGAPHPALDTPAGSQQP